MVYFLLAVSCFILGCLAGVALMCLVQYRRTTYYENEIERLRSKLGM